MSDLKRSYNQESYSIETYLPYFYDIPAECPYGLDELAIYRQQQFVSLPDPLYAKFLEAGFRRNGNTIYSMVCPNCSKCKPIRLNAKTFKPNRNQRRVKKRNADIRITMNVLQITEEKLTLCGKFLQERYPGRGNSAVGYYGTFFANSATSTLEIEYRIDNKLIGIGIVDIGTSWLNAVYFYFDTDESKRSLGTQNILYIIELCRKNDIDNIYLGYLIEEVDAMRYKKNFNPHYLLQQGEWIQSK